MLRIDNIQYINYIMIIHVNNNDIYKLVCICVAIVRKYNCALCLHARICAYMFANIYSVLAGYEIKRFIKFTYSLMVD